MFRAKWAVGGISELSSQAAQPEAQLGFSFQGIRNCGLCRLLFMHDFEPMVQILCLGCCRRIKKIPQWLSFHPEEVTASCLATKHEADTGLQSGQGPWRLRNFLGCHNSHQQCLKSASRFPQVPHFLSISGRMLARCLPLGYLSSLSSFRICEFVIFSFTLIPSLHRGLAQISPPVMNSSNGYFCIPCLCVNWVRL